MSVARLEPRPRRQHLTNRELRVLALAAAGFTNPEISARLLIAEETIKHHLKHAYAALGARNRAHAVAIALRGELIQ